MPPHPSLQAFVKPHHLRSDYPSKGKEELQKFIASCCPYSFHSQLSVDSSFFQLLNFRWAFLNERWLSNKVFVVWSLGIDESPFCIKTEYMYSSFACHLLLYYMLVNICIQPIFHCSFVNGYIPSTPLDELVHIMNHYIPHQLILLHRIIACLSLLLSHCHRFCL